jgi:hypothetical protein
MDQRLGKYKYIRRLKAQGSDCRNLRSIEFASPSTREHRNSNETYNKKRVNEKKFLNAWTPCADTVDSSEFYDMEHIKK